MSQIGNPKKLHQSKPHQTLQQSYRNSKRVQLFTAEAMGFLRRDVQWLHACDPVDHTKQLQGFTKKSPKDQKQLMSRYCYTVQYQLRKKSDVQISKLTVFLFAEIYLSFRTPFFRFRLTSTTNNNSLLFGGSEIPNNHLECKKPYKQWDINYLFLNWQSLPDF